MSNQEEMILRNKRKGFVMVYNDIANNFFSGDALLLWVYLSSKTDNWKIIKTHLCAHFKWSKKKLDKLFVLLAAHGLVKQYQLKGENGKFGKYVIEIDDGENFTIEEKKDPKKAAKKTPKKRTKSQKNPSRINAPPRSDVSRAACRTRSVKSTATTDLILQQNKSLLKNKSSYAKRKEENEKRHEFADSLDQNANEKKHIEEHEKLKYVPMPESLRQLFKGLVKCP